MKVFFGMATLLLLLSCSSGEHCIDSEYKNCRVNVKQYDLIFKGVSLDSIYSILGQPFSWNTEGSPRYDNSGNILSYLAVGHYVWYENIPNPYTNEYGGGSIVLKIKDNKVFAKEMYLFDKKGNLISKK